MVEVGLVVLDVVVDGIALDVAVVGIVCSVVGKLGIAVFVVEIEVVVVVGVGVGVEIVVGIDVVGTFVVGVGRMVLGMVVDVVELGVGGLRFDVFALNLDNEESQFLLFCCYRFLAVL